jgi:hypothetical protein
MKVKDRTGDLESEILKIRLLRSTKEHIMKVAKQEYRSFEKQCQMILDSYFEGAL